MNKISLVVIVLVILTSFSVQANAALQNLGTDSIGNQLIYDTDLDITWYDYSHSADTWDGQMDWASALSVTFGGNTYDDWRLPMLINPGLTPCLDYNCTDSEMGHLYYVEIGSEGGVPYPTYGTSDFENLPAFNAWSGTEYAGSAIKFNFAYGGQFTSDKSNSWSAIAVRDGLAVVPEPISATLFILGGATLGLRRFSKKFKK
jgi:hypothetical protein